jgi:hypothetical protein
MDFITGLPKLGNRSVIMVVVDRLSKYAHFCTLQHPFTTSTVAQIFMDQVFKLHGMPHSIVSNRDPTFTSNFWQELFKIQGTELHLSTTYHPRTDGQTEVVNKCLETYLRCFSLEKKNQWAQWLPLAEWCLLHIILVTLVMSLQVMYSGSHKDFFLEKSDCYLLSKRIFLR